jgi:hypothetical protein
MEPSQVMGGGQFDDRAVLEIEPSLVLLGEQAHAVASLRSADRKPLPQRNARNSWGLFGAGGQLGASPDYRLPINFLVPPLVGEMPIEAYGMSSGAPALLLARGRLVVFEGRDQMLARALREPTEIDGLAVFRRLMALPWSDESNRLAHFRRWLDPHATEDSELGRRAFTFLVELHKKHIEKIVRGMARNYGESRHQVFDELLSRLICRLWDERGKFDPGRGGFPAWACLQLLDCRRAYCTEEKKQRLAVERLTASGATRDAGDLRRLEDDEEACWLIEQLHKRFPKDVVTVYLMWGEGTTLLQIAEQRGIKAGEERGTREAAVRRILSKVENYLRTIRGNGGTK